MKSAHTQIIKIGPMGTLTLCLPEMEGHYMLIEQGEGQITLRAVDLELNATGSREAAAAHDAHGQLVFLPSSGTPIPRV